MQAKVALARPAVVDEAVANAWRTLQTRRSISIAKRTKILFACSQLVDKHQHELAKSFMIVLRVRPRADTAQPGARRLQTGDSVEQESRDQRGGAR